MSLIWTVLTSITLLLVGGLTAQFHLIRSQRQELRKQQFYIGLLRADIGALCAGAVGADQRVSRLEKQDRCVDMGRDSIALQQPDGRPYGEAIHMVQQGATPGELVDRLGLSLSEAELVVMLHGGAARTVQTAV